MISMNGPLAVRHPGPALAAPDTENHPTENLMPRAQWYSPQLRREVVSRLYHLAKAERVPMTRLVDQLVNEALARCGLAHLLSSHEALEVVAGDGLHFLKELPAWSARTRVVVFTAQLDALCVQRAFQAGAWGYVTRRDPVAALLGAVLGAVAGKRHVGPQIEQLLLGRMAAGVVELSGSAVAALSARELEVFRLIGRGLGTQAVADELRLSVKTVETHRQRIKMKLHCRDGLELQCRAVLFQSGSDAEAS